MCTSLGNIDFRIVDKDGGSFCNTRMLSSFSSSCTIPSFFLFDDRGAIIVPGVVVVDYDGASITVFIRNRDNNNSEKETENDDDGVILVLLLLRGVATAGTIPSMIIEGKRFLRAITGSKSVSITPKNIN